MKPQKRKKLERAGFSVGTVSEFLELTGEEAALVEIKVRLVEMFKNARAASGITQQQLAKLISSSQSRVAKLEALQPDVSLDLICKALFALGVSRQAIGRAIASRTAA